MECNRDEATRAKEIAEKRLSTNDVSGAKRFALKAQTLYPDLKGLSQMLAMLEMRLPVQTLYPDLKYNRNEATRAKEIAEKMLSANDVSGAKRFALKAQILYPDLKGLSQMLAMLDVLFSAENKIEGEADWYGILGVDPSSDEETIKKQYKKLALMIHPDKNNSAGADRTDEAFLLIKDAWDFLSDNSKRIAYDQKRFPKTSQQPESGMEDSSTPPVSPEATTSSSSPESEFESNCQCEVCLMFSH